jgi:predicted  nucleic acid-binding Zn-ribbon protein
MTTENSNSNSGASKQRLIAIAAVVVVALLAVNAFLLYNKFKQDKKITQQNVEIEEGEKLFAELEKNYFEALSELESMRTDNEELNSLIEQQQAELKDQKDRIDRIIRSEGDLKRAKSEIRTLKANIQQYIAEIDQLKEENQLLTSQNSELTEDNVELSTNLEQTQEAKTALESDNAVLVSEKERLANENEDLSATVSFASVVKVKNLDVTGLKIKDNGKPTQKKAARNIDQLKVCFFTTINEVTESGREKFYIRVINPVGETVSIEEMGSGIMTSADTKEQIRYTKVKEYDYNNDESQLCILWEPNVPFAPGTYQVEVYNKGHMAGASSFTLK